MNTIREPWHLSRGVTISTILVITLQTLGFAFWLGILSAEVAELKDGRMNKVDKNVVEQMFITRDVQITDVKQGLNENQALLREILQKLHSHNGN